jgi:hypothetical protein
MQRNLLCTKKKVLGTPTADNRRTEEHMIQDHSQGGPVGL